MKSTGSLPETYSHHLDLRPGDYRIGHLLVLLIALPLAFGIYVLFISIARITRPEIVQLPGWNPNFSIPVLISIFLIFVLIAIIHESIHGILIWIHTNEIPKLGFQFPGIGVEAPEWYIPRGQMMFIELAPLLIITIIGVVLLFLVPSRYIGIVAIGATINVAGSYMDLAVFLYTFLLPEKSYIRAAEGYASIYVEKLDESNWKSHLLKFLEQRLLPKLQ
ncbi:MAG: DUF3267 domain-containing protein [Anaerolineaceae bacterium]|nr:DUF3267 domain-containing protein [Anaerolineaceae bacterium]